MEIAIEAASRAIDDYCTRSFFDSGSAAAKTFIAKKPYRLDVPDFSTTTGLVVETDTTGDGTFNVTWDATDFQVEPTNPDDGFPYNRLVAIGNHTFPTGGRRVTTRITAQWGWGTVPSRVKHACAIQAGTLFKRATEGAAPIVTMDGVTLPSSRFVDAQAQMLLNPLRRYPFGIA